jgi:octaprenyl-diphosphate synthase
MTLPLIHLLQQGEDRAEAIVRDIIASRHASDEQWAEIMDRLRAQRSIDYALHRAVEYAELAKKALHVFPSSSERDALMALPDYVLSRDR